jgi:putative membrane protein
LLLGFVGLALLLSGVAPYDRATWWMEVAPVLIVAPLLWRRTGAFR